MTTTASGKMKNVGVIIIATLIGLALSGGLPAEAQQVEIAVPTPETTREPLIIPPGDHGQATRPSDADYYPQSPRVRHDPAFIGPLSSKTESLTGTGRAGVAGWTAPTPPVGSAQTGWREVNGYFAFGIAVEWGGPPPAKRTLR
jgi:hypothetical protein